MERKGKIICFEH